MTTVTEAITSPSAYNHGSGDGPDRFNIHRSIRLLDEFMSGGGWRTQKSAENHLVKTWEGELAVVQAAVSKSIPDGLRVNVYIDTDYLRWEAGIAWSVWFSHRAYADALKWQEGGRLNGGTDPLTKMPTRAQQYRLDARLPMEPTGAYVIPMPSVDELWARTRASRTRPTERKKPGRPPVGAKSEGLNGVKTASDTQDTQNKSIR